MIRLLHLLKIGLYCLRMVQAFVQFLKNGLLSLSPRDLCLFSPPMVIFIAAAAWFVGRLHRMNRKAVPYTRKLFHFMIFSGAGLLQVRFGLKTVVLFGMWTSAAVLFAVARGRGFPFYDALARPKDHPRETLFILVPLAATALGGVLSNLWFPDTAFLGILVTGWADAIAEPVGARWGKHPYHVPSLFGVNARRSLEGSAAVLATGIAAVALCGAWMHWGVPNTLQIALACGVTAAVVEAMSHHGLDNLTVHVAVSAVGGLLLRS